MKICCDENVTRSATEILRQEGYDVVRVQDALDLGFGDDDIMSFCRETDRLVLTNDEDFFDFDDHPGILFLDEQRTPPRDIVTTITRIDRHVPETAGTVWHVPDGWI
jgi:predicted nuclease of predicted toxin-antitoxin system